MKKIIVLSVFIIIFIAVAIFLMGDFFNKSSSENEVVNSILNYVEKQENQSVEQNIANETSKTNEVVEINEPNKSKEGYDINISNKEITIEKGKKSSFVVTFTNPDESSIREYINCEDQNDIILVKYSDIKDSKITVDIDALKVGSTEISVCDYNYPEVKEIVKVKVIEAN